MVTREGVRDMAAAQGRVSGADLLQTAGITYRQLDHWCRIGLLETDARGSGSQRTFDPREVDVAALLGRLSNAGLPPSCDLARRAIDAVRSGDEDVVSDGPLSVFIR